MSRSISDVRWVPAPAVSVVVLVSVLAALCLPEASASAIAGTPTVTVNPNSGLADGQAVAVEVTDFPANTLIGVVECPATATNQDQCGHMVPVTRSTDASGAVSLAYSATRVIFTNQLGRVDCAQKACVIAAGTAFGPFVSASSPVGFIDTQLPPPPFSITLEGPHFLNYISGATIGARLTCDRADSIRVSVQLNQPPSGDMQTQAANDYVYPCAAGADVHIFSDYLFGFQPGDAHVSAFLEVGGTTVAAAVGTVTLISEADILAALNAALAGPDGDAVRARLIDGIKWRITYNPSFRIAWCRAVHCLG